MPSIMLPMTRAHIELAPGLIIDLAHLSHTGKDYQLEPKLHLPSVAK
jgi:hypothetical protein